MLDAGFPGALLTILKTVGAPGSIGFLVICGAAGLVMIYVWPRNRKLGRRWVATVIGGYVVLSLPWTAHAIVARLPTFPPADRASLRPLDTLVVFDGDNSYGRVLEAKDAYAVGSPQIVWILGGFWIARQIAAAGVPSEKILVFGRATTTRDQMTSLQQLSAQRRAGRMALIASRLQMPRIAALARVFRLDMMLVPAPADREPPTSGVRMFLPSYAALGVSRDALYEHAALAYYRWRGWI